MFKSKATNFGDYFKLPNPSLRAYFGKVRSGHMVEYRTNFYKSKSIDDVLQGWKPTLELKLRDLPSLLNFENDLERKVGPMSYMFPLIARVDDINSYYEGPLLPQTPISDSAIAAVLKEWSGMRGSRMISQHTAMLLSKKSTNSGSPYFMKRRDVGSRTVPFKLGSGKSDVYQITPGFVGKACAVLGWRGQEGGRTANDVKQRVIWMFPYAVNIAESQVYFPLVEHAQRLSLVPAWIGNEAVDLSITKMFDTKAKEDMVMCTDFTKFDQHFGSSCQKAAHTILQGLFSGDNFQSWLADVFPIKFNIPLAVDYGTILYGPHGMGSGSGGTNADETITHRALQYAASQAAGSKLNPHSQCLGDDGVLTFPGLTSEVVVNEYTSHGLLMNEDKQYLSTDDCTYLRRWHHKDYREGGVCVGVYSTYRALGRLMEQERYYDPEKWGPKMVALRQLSILENVKFHPAREEFVDYCMKGDSYRLGCDIPGFFDDIANIAKEAIDYMPDFLGYTRSLEDDAGSGIEKWWIVNYLKSK